MPSNFVVACVMCALQLCGECMRLPHVLELYRTFCFVAE